MSLTQKTSSASFWQLLNVGLFSIMNIVFLMVTARWIDKSYHGVFAVMQIMVVILSMISKGGFYLALVRRKENTDEQISFAFWASILLGVFFTVLVFILADPISAFYDHTFPPGTVKLISLYFIGFAIGSVSLALMIRELDFKRIFISQCGSYLIGSIGIGLYMAYSGYQLWALIYGYLAFIFLNSVFNYALKPHSIKWTFSKAEFDEVIHFSIGFTLTELLNNAATQIDKLIIAKFTNMTSLAIFDKGQQTTRLPVRIFGNAFDHIIYSVFSKLQYKADDLKSAFLRLSSIFWIITFFVSLFIYTYAMHIVVILLGNSWMETIPFLKIFALTMPLVIISKVSDALFRAQDKLYKASFIKVFYLVGVIASALLAYRLELIQVAILISMCYVFYVLAYTITAIKELNLALNDYLIELKPALILAVIFFATNELAALAFSNITGRLWMMLLALSIHFLLMLLLLRIVPKVFGKNNLRFFIQTLETMPFKTEKIIYYLKSKL